MEWYNSLIPDFCSEWQKQQLTIWHLIFIQIDYIVSLIYKLVFFRSQPDQYLNENTNVRRWPGFGRPLCTPSTTTGGDLQRSGLCFGRYVRCIVLSLKQRYLFKIDYTCFYTWYVTLLVLIVMIHEPHLNAPYMYSICDNMSKTKKTCNSRAESWRVTGVSSLSCPSLACQLLLLWTWWFF